MERCELCGEPITEKDEKAEMFDPLDPERQSVICHAECGLQNDYQIA
jgi:hypothetical protein